MDIKETLKCKINAQRIIMMVKFINIVTTIFIIFTTWIY